MIIKQKKMALINDITGFGRCSVAVMAPILSAFKIQAVAIPTAILSTHTQFPEFYFDDYNIAVGYDDVEYTIQWQTSFDNENWFNIDGATEETLDMEVTTENYENFWRVMVDTIEETQES